MISNMSPGDGDVLVLGGHTVRTSELDHVEQKASYPMRLFTHLLIVHSTDTLNLLESSDINLNSVSLLLLPVHSLSCVFDSRVKKDLSQP